MTTPKQISTSCVNTVHNECDGRVHKGGKVVARCECDCHQEGVLAAVRSVPSVNPPMKEEIHG